MILQSHSWAYIQRKLSFKKICAMFMATLFTVAKTGKKPKYPSSDEWIKKMWYALRKPELKETHAPQCSSQHCL